MKFIIGFIFGLMVASAAAQVGLAIGKNPAGLAVPILVDVHGYVICSTEKP